MTTLRIHHRTRYLYDAPVSFGVHRLMLRPRDGHDMRILDSALTISPPATLRWAFDTFGNSVAFASFRAPADELVIQSDLLLRRYGLDEPAASVAPQAEPYPFTYDEDDLVDLAPLLRVHCPPDAPAIQAWLKTALPEAPEGSLDALQTLAAAIYGGFAYSRREEQGVQSPGETLATGSGTCRDFAFLFMEASRHLGFAARFVTGYLYDPARDSGGGEVLSGTGATHAWADIFVPGVGWIEIDPTNGIIAGKKLVRVATTRTPAQAMPVAGSYEGGAGFVRMDVTVTLEEAAGAGGRLAGMAAAP